MREVIDKADEIWGKTDDGSIPPLLNKTAVRKVLSKHIQISDRTINFLDVVFFCILRVVVKECKKRDIKRMSIENVKEILTEDKNYVFNIGSVIYKNAEMDELEDIIVDRVFKKIVMRTFGSAITEANKEEFDFEEAEFPTEDGVENE